MEMLEKVRKSYHDLIYHGDKKIVAFIAYPESHDVVKSFELAKDDLGELWFVATWWYESDGTKRDIHRNAIPKGKVYRLPYRAPSHYNLLLMPSHIRHLILEHYPWTYVKVKRS